MQPLIPVDEVEITLLQRILPLGAALLIALVTVELIRRRKLREEYAMLWISASGLLLIFAIFPRLLLHLSVGMGVFYLTTVVVLVFSFLALVLLHLAVIVSRSSEDVRQIAQRLALLEHKMHEQQSHTGVRSQVPMLDDAVLNAEEGDDGAAEEGA
ncbi:MAG: hypothetical protein BWX88_00203 [Planctomycetes bacterium ADurb.Bin126]|nr:MAG: hypothetical protein BWX88_00203 [Planctomycetes bacterium ADurb.Bin126]HOD80663.1 DUF2304 domain-containing protein [Phycisphaerae bacterium]HQL73891.1 DUF2304 domain-containing protein [Phycisphaerae bacterium]